MREGHPLPPKIANAPDLRLGLELYFSAFLDLSNSRTGMGDGPIPWHVVAEYARINEFDDAQTEELHYHIARMDSVYMKWARNRPANQPKRK